MSFESGRIAQEVAGSTRVLQHENFEKKNLKSLEIFEHSYMGVGAALMS